MKSVTMLTAVIFLLAAFTSQAQEAARNGQVSGVVSANQKPIESAAVSLLRAKDSSVIRTIATDKAGHFELQKIANGKYLVRVQNVGFDQYLSNTFEISTQKTTYTLPAIHLKAADKDLGNVTVTSKRPLIEQKIDRTVVNVEASINNVGATALEVLEKSPGVTVDKDGNISLKGKQGVTILIDGKPSYLSGDDLANLLRNMNAAQLDQIEIMTNPPAKYDAAGNAGVINIKTKKTKIKGLNGSVTAGYGQGVYPKTNQSLNFNYRDGKWNLFGNYSFNYRENFQSLDISRNFTDSATKQLLSIFNQSAVINNISRSHNLKLGADFYANKKTTVGIVLTGFDNIGTGITKNTTYIYDNTNALNSITKANSVAGNNWKNFSTNLNYRHVYDTLGRELTADLDYVGYDARSTQLLANNYFNAAGSSTQKGDTLNGNLPSNISIYSAKADYTHPLKKGAKLELGFKVSYVQTDNNAQYDSVINNQYVHDYNRSNHFIYKENINALYVNFNKQLNKRWGMQLGLRVENTQSKGNQLGNAYRTGSQFDTSYTQLFPTAYISYQLNTKNQFVLNYGRRIQRPSYQDLNPFVQFIDRYTFQQGNPSLHPQFSHNIELSHMFMGGALTTTLNYTKVTDIIEDVIQQNASTNETFQTKSNIAQLDQFGISMSAYLPLKKWWTFNLYSNVYRNRFRGTINGTYIDVTGTTFVGNVTSSFKFNKGWGVEVSGFYRGSGIDGVIVSQPLGAINFGASKTVLKGKGTIRLSYRDPFRLQYFRGYSKYGNVDASFINHWDNTVINMGFTYRFSKGKTNTPQRQRHSVDEQSRVNMGNNN